MPSGHTVYTQGATPVLQVKVGLNFLYSLTPHTQIEMGFDAVFDLDCMHRQLQELYSLDSFKELHTTVFSCLDGFSQNSLEIIQTHNIKKWSWVKPKHIPYTRQITTVHTKSFSWQSVTLPLQTPVWVVRREKSLCVRYLSIHWILGSADFSDTVFTSVHFQKNS